MKRTNSLILSLGALVALYSPSLLAGSGSHGGDTVLCEKTATSDPKFTKFDGVFTLDYLVTSNHANNDADVVPVNHWEESQARIRELIRWKIPGWLSSWDEYVASILKPVAKGAPRKWVGGPEELIPVTDEGLVRYLPKNCTSPLQTIVRQRLGIYTIYEYDAARLTQVALHPLQYSFLMVHEWLWDHFDDPAQIRQMNRLLHSTEIEQMTAKQVYRFISDIGGRGLSRIEGQSFVEELARIITEDDVPGFKRILFETETTDFIVFSEYLRPHFKTIRPEVHFVFSSYTPFELATLFGKEKLFEELLPAKLILPEPYRSEGLSNALKVAMGAKKLKIVERLLQVGAQMLPKDLSYYISDEPRILDLIFKTGRSTLLTYTLVSTALNNTKEPKVIIQTLIQNHFEMKKAPLTANELVGYNFALCERDSTYYKNNWILQETDLLLSAAFNGSIEGVKALLETNLFDPHKTYRFTREGFLMDSTVHLSIPQVLQKAIQASKSKCYSDRAEPYMKDATAIIELLK